MTLDKCPSCLKEGEISFCRNCLRLLFDGKKVNHVLPFAQPELNDLMLKESKHISISGAQAKYSLKLNKNRFELTDRGGSIF